MHTAEALCDKRKKRKEKGELEADGNKKGTSRKGEYPKHRREK
jgi:hypothetical protein